MKKSNISDVWINALGSKPYRISKEAYKSKIEYYENDNILTEVKINEDEVYFTVTSVFGEACLNSIKENYKESYKFLCELSLELNQIVPIGHYIVDEYDSKNENELGLKFAYKVHQRFIDSENIINIEQIISLIKDDHQQYFHKLLGLFFVPGVGIDQFREKLNDYIQERG